MRKQTIPKIALVGGGVPATNAYAETVSETGAPAVVNTEQRSADEAAAGSDATSQESASGSEETPPPHHRPSTTLPPRRRSPPPSERRCVLRHRKPRARTPAP